ncbi:unnamed protein product, partial [Ectocarpus fasciculatus]
MAGASTERARRVAEHNGDPGQEEGARKKRSWAWAMSGSALRKTIHRNHRHRRSREATTPRRSNTIARRNHYRSSRRPRGSPGRGPCAPGTSSAASCITSGGTPSPGTTSPMSARKGVAAA